MQTAAPETGRDSKVSSGTRGVGNLTPATHQTHRDQPSRDLEVSEELASELNITDAERKQVNTLIAKIETDRRQLFDALSRRERTKEEITTEMGELRTQLNEDIRNLLGDERATALFEALR
jgi:hypothetical protein